MTNPPTSAPLAPFPPFPTAGLVAGDLLIRIWQPDRDAPERHRLMRDPDQDRWATPFFVPRPVDLAATRALLERDRDRAQSGEPASYAVVSVAGEQLLGDIGCRLENPRMRIADVGYGTLPEARGRGVASTALRLLSDWLLSERRLGAEGPALARVQLDHAVANAASCAVATKAGFEQEGVRRGYLPLIDPDTAAGWTRADVCLHGRVAAELR